MTEEFLMFRMRDIERNFNMRPGEFEDLDEEMQWSLFRYHELMTDPTAKLEGYHPSFHSLSSVTPGQIMLIVSQVFGRKKSSAVSIEELSNMDSAAIPEWLRGALER